MKLTRSDLRQLIREVIQKEGIGDWLDRMRAADKESGAEYREKRAASEQEKEEKEASGTRIGGSKRKKFAGSELGKGAEKELREEEEVKELRHSLPGVNPDPSADEETDTRAEPDFSEYELATMDTDHQTVALLKDVLSQLKTLNQYMTPAKSLGASGVEKAMAGMTVAEGGKK